MFIINCFWERKTDGSNCTSWKVWNKYNLACWDTASWLDWVSTYLLLCVCKFLNLEVFPYIAIYSHPQFFFSELFGVIFLTYILLRAFIKTLVWVFFLIVTLLNPVLLCMWQRIFQLASSFKILFMGSSLFYEKVIFHCYQSQCLLGIGCIQHGHGGVHALNNSCFD